MVKLTLKSFNGEIPRIQPHYLPDGHAVSARNARLTSGALAPMKGGLLDTTLAASGAASIAMHDGTWHDFPVPVDAAPGPVADNRLYLTRADAAPQLFDGSNWVPLALPAPTVAPMVALTGSPSENAESVIYAFTWVTPLGEESAPSPLSASLLFSDGCTINLTALPGATDVSGRPVAHKRIYRSQTSASGATELFLIAEILNTDTTFDDVHGSYPNMEAIPTKDFDAPPSTMRGLIPLPNGMMAAFDGKEVLFCEPYQPHAWPASYALATEAQIVGLGAFGSSVAVMTTASPYLIQGLSPDAMAMEKVEVPHSCVAKRSIVDMGYSVIYASPLGLVEIREGGASLISKNIWTKAEWEKIGAQTIEAARFGEAYVFSYIPADQATRKVAIINVNGDQPSLVHCDIIAKGFYTDPATSKTYYLDETGGAIYEFDAGDPMTYTWLSKPFRLPNPAPMGVATIDLVATDQMVQQGEMTVLDAFAYSVVLGDATVTSETEHEFTLDIAAGDIVQDASYALTIAARVINPAEPVSLKIYGDGALLHTLSVTSAQIQRLPEGSYREWQFELTGTSEIIRMTAAHTPGELA